MVGRDNFGSGSAIERQRGRRRRPGPFHCYRAMVGPGESPKDSAIAECPSGVECCGETASGAGALPAGARPQAPPLVRTEAPQPTPDAALAGLGEEKRGSFERAQLSDVSWILGSIGAEEDW